MSANSAVTNNTLTLRFGGTTSQVSVIENVSGSAGISNVVFISNNLITNCTNSLTTTGIFNGIYNTASTSNLNITNNTFSNNTSNATSGATYLIRNAGAVSSLLNITNNNLSHSYTGATAYTGSTYGISSTSGTTLTSTSINNNVYTNFNHVNVTGTGGIYFLYNSFGHSNLSINNNNFNGLTLNHSGLEYFLYNSSSTQSALTVSSNSITNITRIVTAGSMYCYYGAGSSLSTCSQIISNNLFSNITATVSGTGIFYGLYTTDGLSSPYPKKTITNNTLSNINYNTTGSFYGLYFSDLGDGSTTSGSTISSNKLQNITVKSSIFYGLYNSSTASPNYPTTVTQNTVSNITCDGAGSTIYATYVMGGAGGTNFFKNKVHDITANGATGTVHGLYAVTSPTTNIYNNLIGNLYAPNTSGDSKVNGIYIFSGTNTNVYSNTVYIPAATTSTAALFGSNAIYASITPTVTLRNNIFVNLSTPVGLGYASAYRRSSATLTSYASVSNNNLFYAGIPSANNLIYFDGTTGHSILSAYKLAVAPMDGLSVTENANFASTLGSAANFLNINTVIGTQIESGALPIAGITDDYIGTLRNVSTPDIGAWEGNYTAVSCAPPTSVAVNSVSQTSVNATWSVPLSGSPVNYFYELRTTGAAGSGTLGLVATGTITAPTTSVNITGLTELTGYNLYVQGNCGSSSLSIWSAPATFTTLAYCPVSSTVTISSITPVSAVSSWTAAGTVPQWDVYYGSSTIVPSATTVATATTAVNSYTINSLTPSTNYSVYVRAVCSSSYSSIWTPVATFTTPCLPPNVLTTTGNIRWCIGTTTLGATTTSGATLQWYANPTGGAPIGTGPVFTTPTISATTNYYVSSTGGLITETTGRPSPASTATGFITSTPTWGIVFNTANNVLINTATIYPVGTGSVTIALLNSAGTELASTPSMPVTGSGVSTPVTVNLGFSVPVGTGYRIVLKAYSGITNLIRDISSSTFPYVSASGAMSVTGGWTGSAISASYYWFYNLNLSIGCESPRTMVTATVNPLPTVTITTTSTLICNGASAVLTAASTATTISWSTGQTTSSISITPTVTSTYSVTVTDNNGCISNPASIVLNVFSCTGTQEFISDKVSVYPNPNTGILNIALPNTLSQNSIIEIYDAIGKLVVAKSLTNEMNTINISNLDNGIYLFKILNNTSAVKIGKLVKQ